MLTREIGCCGAYCRTCRAYGTACKGCKVGYDTGERDLRKARCQIKVCCITEKHATCADCAEYRGCSTLGVFHAKKGHKYAKYRQSLEYIRSKGYRAFLTVADKWTNAYGTLPAQMGTAKPGAVEPAL